MCAFGSHINWGISCQVAELLASQGGGGIGFVAGRYSLMYKPIIT